MATVRVKFRASSLPKKEGVIYFQLIHKRRVKLITTRYKLFSQEWDKRECSLIIDTKDKERVAYLQNLKYVLEQELDLLDNLVDILERRGEYTIETLVSYYESQALNGNLFPFMESKIAELKEGNKMKTAIMYSTVLRSFKEFRNEQDIPISRMDNYTMKRYENYLKSKNILLNSISCYMRTLRSVYNKAVEEGLSVQQYPFRNVYTGIAKTIKRSVKEDIIIQLKRLELDDFEGLSFARDLFMFSFYTRGMSFVDMARLKKSNIKNEAIEYTRSKTCQLLTIKIEECILEIIDRYKNFTVDSEYLLPIIRPTDNDHNRALRVYNKRLRRLSELLGLSPHISSYTSRHTWASLAREKGIPLQVISEGMGHENEQTTRIYLASLDQSVLDKANASVILLQKETKKRKKVIAI